MEPLLAVVSDSRYRLHLENMSHLESPRRLQALDAILQHAPFAKRWMGVEPRLATVEEIGWIHSAAYIQKVEKTSGCQLSSFDIDTQASARSYDTARLAVGGVFAMLDEIIRGRVRRGFACIRPPGHHAEKEKAMGFCIFNNAALGARYLQTCYGLEKIMIVDIDAHHGNGIQSAFYDSPAVLYTSWHQFPGFPGTGNLNEMGNGPGLGFTVNIPLGKGQGNRDFARIIRYLIRPLALAYRPQVLLVPCGFDLYRRDRLAGMACTPEGYALLARLLIQIAETVCQGRIGFIMEGGYSLRGIEACGLRLLQELCDLPTLPEKTLCNAGLSRPLPFSTLYKVIQVQRAHWPSLR
ncbi:MAG: histone deacetylase [Deltaproteobacteria bacterium]|nr:histone deacetylase [Deltaproteobacteria bacterium]